MWIESIMTHLLLEKLRPYFKRKPRNNEKAIAAMMKEMPVFQNVGELRQLLTNFSDDVEMQGGSFQYPHLQLRVINGKGLIFLGSGTEPPRSIKYR